MQNITLYYFDGCPFCKRVSDYLAKEKITVPMKNIHEKEEYRKELLDIGGKTQVPCLIINSRAMYESMDIIRWFENNYKRS